MRNPVTAVTAAAGGGTEADGVSARNGVNASPEAIVRNRVTAAVGVSAVDGVSVRNGVNAAAGVVVRSAPTAPHAQDAEIVAGALTATTVGIVPSATPNACRATAP